MIVNGDDISLNAAISLHDFLISKGFDVSRVAVEVNGTIVPRANYGSTTLSDTDSVEIVGMVGGG